MNFRKAIPLLVCPLLMLVGCKSEPKDLSGTTLTPTRPDQVMLYQQKPEKYDIVGTISLVLTPNLTWNERAEATQVFELLKAEAAKKGANGILFEMNPGEYDAVATASNGTSFYQVPIKLNPQRTAVARAILVKEEK